MMRILIHSVKAETYLVPIIIGESSAHVIARYIRDNNLRPESVDTRDWEVVGYRLESD